MTWKLVPLCNGLATRGASRCTRDWLPSYFVLLRSVIDLSVSSVVMIVTFVWESSMCLFVCEEGIQLIHD